MNVRGKKSADREEAAAALAKGTWEGTSTILLGIAQESMYTPGWRPLRAAALFAARDMSEEDATERAFMSAEQFDAWRKEARALAKVRGDGNPMERVGLSPWQGRQFAKEGAPKAVALACAHYSLGMPLPIPPDDPRAFDDWFRPRFGGTERIAAWLGITSNWLSTRLQGWQLVRGERSECLPPAYLIRALDWVATVGPFCPYGVTPPTVWPGQELDEGGY